MGLGVGRKVFWGGVSAAVIDLSLSGFSSRGTLDLSRGARLRLSRRYSRVSRCSTLSKQYTNFE